MLKMMPLWVLIFLLFVGILSACKPLKRNRIVESHSNNNAEGIHKKKVVVMLHGLWESAKEFETSIQKAKKAFASYAMDVLIDNSLEEEKTSELSITDQATQAFQVIKHQYPASDYEIILWGHSQGGLRSVEIIKLNQKNNKPLAIKGLITTSTPWEGTPVAAITQQKVKKYLKKSPFKYLLAKIESNIQIDENYIDHVFATYLPGDPNGPGVKDLVPNSNFLKNVAADLVNNTLPILAIGGSNGDVRKILLDTNIPVQLNIANAYIKMFPLNSFYRYIFVGGWMRDHDMVVPLASQLASNISKNNQFKAYIVPDAIHDFLPGLPIDMDQVIYNHPDVIKQVVAFAQQNFTWQTTNW